MRSAQAESFARGYSSHMPRCMHPDDALVGVMGLDEPPPNTCGKNPGLDTFVRNVRMGVGKYIPPALIINQKLQFAHNMFSREGIGFDILRRGVCSNSPPRNTLAAALQKRNKPQQEEALRACANSWGIKAARHAIAHSLRHNPYSIVHILTVHRSMEMLIGHHDDVQEARQAIRQGLLATAPSQMGDHYFWDRGQIESKGKKRLFFALMELHNLLKEDRYQRVLFHPGLRRWGKFSPAGEYVFWTIAAAGMMSLYFAGFYTLAFAASTAMALACNEVRLWLRDAWSDESQASGGLKAWLLSTRYTGGVYFV